MKRFSLIPGRAANVSGTATDSQGRPLAGRQVQVSQQWRGPGFGMMTADRSGAQTAADGTFRIKNLAPGEYVLGVQGTTEINGANVQESASAPIVVSGVDLDNVGGGFEIREISAARSAGQVRDSRVAAG